MQAGTLFSPTINWLQPVGIFFPVNWLQKVDIFFQNIKLAPGSRYIFPSQQLAPASGHIIFPQLSIGPSMWIYYFPLTLNCPQENISWLKQAGILFFPNYQLALESGHTILPQHTIGSSNRAYFSPTLICPQQMGILFFQNSWLKQAGTLFFPNYQLAQASGHIIFFQLPNGSSKRAYYFSLTINWLKQAGILFFPNYQMAQASRHIIFPQLSIGFSKRAYYFFHIQLAPASGHIFPKH